MRTHSTDLGRAAIAANRFGLGARPGELEAIRAAPERWLLRQLDGPSRVPAAIRDLPTSASALAEIQALRRERRAARASDAEVGKAYGRAVRAHYRSQVAARYTVAAETGFPFHERLVHFWSNHFAISADKQALPAVAGLYENEAIRPHVCGSFRDLLRAATRHPAMLLYLDNPRSVGPNSTLGRRARRRSDRNVGLNENLAREILELHTLGVDGGYDQADVTAFARVLTGWSIGGSDERGRFRDGEPGRFEFREAIHEPGAQTVVGKRYAQRGVDQGEAVLSDLATHPATAGFIATKLARHFVADAPPAAVVDRLREAFLESGGDLPTVYRALVEAPLAWQATPAKLKSPHDFVVSTFRALQQAPERRDVVIAALDFLGQAAWRPGSPAGWPDDTPSWGGADAVYKRIEWSNTVARYAHRGRNPLELADAVLGDAMRPATRRTIARAENPVQGLTLLLASPDFQRR